MNCKPGDLAIYVRTNYAANRQYLGSVVRCIEMWAHPRTSKPGWRIEPAIGEWTAITDECLRPIRDPGEDATDETLLWKAVPKDDELTKEDAELLLDALREWAREQV